MSADTALPQPEPSPAVLSLTPEPSPSTETAGVMSLHALRQANGITQSPREQAVAANDRATQAFFEGKTQEAIDALQGALELDPDCEPARLNLARLQEWGFHISSKLVCL